jgi:hypothetical protein
LTLCPDDVEPEAEARDGDDEPGERLTAGKEEAPDTGDGRERPHGQEDPLDRRAARPGRLERELIQAPVFSFRRCGGEMDVHEGFR